MTACLPDCQMSRIQKKERSSFFPELYSESHGMFLFEQIELYRRGKNSETILGTHFRQNVGIIASQ